MASARAPDVVYHGAKVVTVDDAFTIASAFAVSDGRFVGVGTNEAMLRLAGPQTAIVDFSGLTVLPGFIDCHAHAANGHASQLSLKSVSLFGVSSVAQVVDRIRAAAARSGPGEWISTTGIGEPPDYFGLPESLVEGRWPTADELDAAAPENPVFIYGSAKQPYPSVLNHEAMAALEISAATADEGRLRIVKDPSTGEPNGLVYGLDVHNHSSQIAARLKSLLPPVDADTQLAILRDAIRENNAAGVTAIYEPHGMQPTRTRAFRHLHDARDLHNRVVISYEVPRSLSIDEIETWLAEIPEIREAREPGTGDDYLKIRGITVSIDGATQHGAALMHEPYLDPHGQSGNGRAAFSVDDLTNIARLAVRKAMRLNVVAAGDLACQMVVDAFEVVHNETSLRGRRWVVGHYQHPSPANLASLARMGVVGTTYSSVDYSKGAQVYRDRFPGRDVWRTVVPLRWWMDAGVPIAQSTDGAHYEPLFTLWESLVRVDGRTGTSLLTPEKTISREEAIRMYTINGAIVLGLEDQIGSIEAGKAADFVVLETDLLDADVDAIRDARVVATAIDGRFVYDRSGGRCGAANGSG